MSRHAYYAAALADAQSRGLTAAQVRNATFAQVATASGLDPDNVPADFFYVSIRRRVANKLKDDAQEAQEAARRVAIRAKVRELVDAVNAEVERIEPGVFLVRINP